MRATRFLVGLVALLPAVLAAQQIPPAADVPHVAVEATSLVLDEERVRRLGLEGGAVWVGTRLGGLEVSAWLDAVRRDRAARRESTQRLLVRSGSEAELSGRRTLVGLYGAAVQAGPALWVQPTALEDGRVRLRLWTTTGEARAAHGGILERSDPIEASTEIVVPSGTPLVVASREESTGRSERGLLGRGASEAGTRSWIVLTARVVEDPARAFPLPEGIRSGSE